MVGVDGMSQSRSPDAFQGGSCEEGVGVSEDFEYQTRFMA